MLSGVKEDIILSEYTEDATYTFILETEGLYLYNSDNGYYLADSVKVDPVFYLGEIIIYDAVGKPDIGTMTVETITQGEKYLLIISANDEFLSDPTTVYPVTVDPSISISDSDTSGSIIDSPIFKGYPDRNFGTYVYNRVGTPSEAYGIGRTVVKLSGLISSNEYRVITANQIKNVTFYAKEASGGTTHYINLYPLTSNTTWTETSVTWNNIGAHTTSVNYGNTMYNGQWTAFNITNLVKAWKSGTYSANAGFIMTNGNETKDKCFCSSEYSTSASRPYVVMTYDTAISLNYTSTSIVEGGTRTLVATTKPSGQAVTWSTSNSSIATVSSSGVVTAKKAGNATITARTVGADGITRTATCTIYVYIANGVYYIKNLNSNYYLQVKYGGIANFNDVYQYSKYSDSTNNTYKIRQMWKTYYLGNGRYSIRPLNKLDMGLDVTGSNVDIYNIGTSDTLYSVPSCAEWTISWYSTGYIFKNTGSNNKTMQIENASTLSGATVVAAAYSTSVNCRWGLTKVSSPPSGMYLYDTNTKSIITTATKYVAPRESRTLSEQSIAVVSYDGLNISQTFSWTPVDGSFVSVDSSGSITGKSSGTTTIAAKKVLNGTTYSISYTVITTPIANGTYYIQNKQTRYYADIKDTTMVSGTRIHQWEYHGGNSQKWIFKHLGNGYYSIKSSNSSSAYYMGVINDSIALDVDVVLRTGTITNGMMWKIESTVNGAYKIIPRTGASSGYILATTTFNALNGYKLIQGDYVDNNSYQDEWLINGVSYSINLEPQHQTEWCWAASARMMSQRKTIGAITQESAAVYVKLGIKTVSPTVTQIATSNVSATVTETEQALEYILGSNDIYSKWGSIYSESVLRTLLDNNPVIILRGWYNSSGTRRGGHYVVIYDYHWDSTNELYVYDIFNPGSLNIGSSYSRSYQSICNGMVRAYQTDITDDGIWEGIVVYKSGNYKNTIPWQGN